MKMKLITTYGDFRGLPYVEKYKTQNQNSTVDYMHFEL